MKQHLSPGSSPWRSFSLLVFLCGALVAGCGTELPVEPSASFEEFKATVPREPDGAYLVEGDILLHGDEALRAYYESSVAPASRSTADGPQLAQQESSLAAAMKTVSCQTEQYCDPIPCLDLYVCDPFIGPASCQPQRFCAPTSQTVYVCDFSVFPASCGWRTVTLNLSCSSRVVCTYADDIWSSSQALNLTYCLKDFGSRYTEVAKAVRSAARAWEKVANVRFIHRRDLDGAQCGSGVVLTVQPQPGASFLAAATYPSNSVHTLSINLPGIDAQDPLGPNTRSLEQLLTHELGHALGFRHERSLTGDENCPPVSSSRNLTSFDPVSIMRYPSCPVSQPDAMRELSARDAQGARAIYGAPAKIRQVGLRTSDGCFLKAENEGGGKLSSRGNGIFPWETFELIDLGNSQVALRARNGDFVAAETDTTLSANRAQLGPWERFTMTNQVGGGVTLRTAHGKYVSAQCTTTIVGSNDGGQPSNQFQIIDLEDTPIALKATNGRFLVTKVTPTATGTRIFRDESLFLVQLGNGKVALRSRDGRYARAINGGGGAVAFDSPGLGTHETYTLQTMPGEFQVAFKALSGHWLAIDGSGRLVASATSAQPFMFTALAGERLALRAFNGQFVQAVQGGGYDVKAVGSAAGEWETFFLVRLGGGKVALRNAQGMYVTAEPSGTASSNGLLYSRADWIDTWERFTLSGTSSRSCLKAESTNLYVAAEGGGGRELVANRSACADWEGFGLTAF